MKTLSIKQPWASLIVSGYKQIENRDWKYAPSHRGPFFIHAAKQDDESAYWWLRFNKEEILAQHPDFVLPSRKSLKRGGIIGRADLVDVVYESDDVWFQGSMGFVLRNAQRLRFTPTRGQLGFFETSLSILA